MTGNECRRTASAYAKINLFLDVREKRGDGYHELVSVMQRISLCDEVTAAKSRSGVSVVCDAEGLSGEKNLAYAAAQAFYSVSGISGGVDIGIRKRIPIAAGLGGGSSDAATVICLMNEIYGLPLSEEQLMRVGFSVGADVPFFIKRCAAATVYGAGEKVVPCAGLSGCDILIAVDGKKGSTGAMYRLLDAVTRKSAEENGIITALAENNIVKTGENLYNSFEAVYKGESAVRKIMQNGARGVMLCGSGPCVFALYDDRSAAEAAEAELLRRGIPAFAARPI